MHFQQSEDLKFLISSGEAFPGTPQNPCRVSKRRELGGIVSIFENLESRLNFSRETSIPILINSSHKPTSREVYFW